MAVALDGSGEGAVTGTPLVIALTTANAPGLIVVVFTGTTATPTVSATGLTFTQREAFVSGSKTFWEYAAPYSSNFSGNISVSGLGGGQFYGGIAWGISGAPASSYFDPNGSLPATALGVATGSTSNANDFIFSAYAMGAGGVSAGAGWTQIQDDANFILAQYQIVSATQSSLAGNTGNNGDINFGILDAVVAGGGSPADDRAGRNGALQATLWFRDALTGLFKPRQRSIKLTRPRFILPGEPAFAF